MLRFGIAGPGFNNRLVCGTINYFNGWVVNSDKPITEVQFHLGTRKVGSLPIRRDRPDLVKRFGRSMLGFSGVVDLPEDAVGQRLRLFASDKDGTLYPMNEYPLEHVLSEDQKRIRKENLLPSDWLIHLVAIASIRSGSWSLGNVRRSSSSKCVPNTVSGWSSCVTCWTLGWAAGV